MNTPVNPKSTFDAESLGQDMIDAVRNALAGRGAVLQAIAEQELRRLAATLADIGSQLASGQISAAEAKSLTTIYQKTFGSVLKSAQGLGVLATRQALQAVVRVGAGVLNRLLGFKLL